MKDPAAVAENNNNTIVARSTSLIALVVQQVALVLLIRYSRTREQPDATGTSSSYLASTAVVAAEVGKLLLNLSLEVVTTTYYNNSFSVKKLWNEIFSRDSWRLVVPAFLYVVQNNLLFVALGNLSVPVYQVTNQGKLLTTAICSRWLLQKNISWMQYASLVLLAAGVAVVQLSSMSNTTISSTTSKDEQLHDGGNQLIGLAAVISSCFTSGFAGVYFEKVLKSQKKTTATTTKESSVYMRNCQLAVYSIALALLNMFATDYPVIAKHGVFAGYDAIVWLVIFCQAMTGLIVALVMKYADTILKGFCTSVAVVVATLLSILLFGTKVDGWFAVGSAMVVGAVQMYSKYPPPTSDTSLTIAGDSGTCIGPSYQWGSVCRLLVGLAIFMTSIVQVGVAFGVIQSQVNTIFDSHYLDAAKEYIPTSMTDMVPETLSDMITSNVNALSDVMSDVRALGSEEKSDAECHNMRNISAYNASKFTRPTKKSNWKQCLRFQCSWNVTSCDNTGPTNFDGPDPPCCVHVMRDMANQFDRVMCHLGLEYFPSYGMLLGLERADRLIPWTSDNDYVVTKQTILAMEDVWDEASHLNHGLSFLWDLVYHLCITPDFAGGKLLPWKVNETSSWYADSVYPFADIFTADVNTTSNKLTDERECIHNVNALRPVQRRLVYNGTFYQNFPNDPNAVLTELFGNSWRTPDAKKKSHGGTHCGRRRARQAKRERQRQENAAPKK